MICRYVIDNYSSNCYFLSNTTHVIDVKSAADALVKMTNRDQSLTNNIETQLVF